MFKAEKPINSVNEDVLDRAKVAIDLSKHIQLYKDNNNDSLTIGIIGDWGSGKTSFINMVLESIPKTNDYIIIHFNPWNISTRKQLISDFFMQLSNEIGRIDTATISKEVGNNLKKISKIFKPLSMIPIPQISVFTTMAGKMFDEVGGTLSEYAELQELNLDDLKEKLNVELEKLNSKIIIVIDDIDRLADNDIGEIFQLVKSIADFKNTIYILAYDDAIVTNALNKLQNGKGQEYIEKIIQVPILLPYISKEEINKIFIKKLNEYLKNISTKDFDSEYFTELYLNGIKNNLTNIREVERYFNTFNFGFNVIKEELNICDYIVITLFKVFEPNLYRYIQENKAYFTGVNFGENFGLNSEEKMKIIKEELEEQFENLKKINSQKAKNLIKILFPKINTIYNNSTYGYPYILRWNKNRRIASPKYFDNYFKLTFSENEIRKSELRKILNFNSKEELKNSFNVENSKKLELLDRILEVVDELKVEKEIEFLKFILSLTDVLEFEGQITMLTIGQEPRYKVSRIFYAIFDKATLEKKVEIINNIFQCEECSIYSLILILENFKKDKEKHQISEHLFDGEGFLIQENLLDKLTELLINRVIARSKKAETIPRYLADILYAMKRIDKYDEAKVVFKNYLENKKLLIQLMETFIGIRTVETNYKIIEEKYIMKDYVEFFINYDELIKMIDDNITSPTPKEKEIINLLKNPKTEKN